ncbi:uncharacterized protein LOC130928618 isoform X2 [Corythoichthys intestinalis]|uniref:uncharacterized protein LOC130928618 isoform X2 n=1 Tax=Corythoichthys intestinalis TaxID=161448 RepID=UPI0025A4F6E7|nr:uncharacterized protein LOC130928618 isoform X2 [Corythoichthys intestinalis]
MWGYLVLILSSLACSYQASNFSGVVVAVHYTINSRNECINPFWTCLSGYCGLKAQEFNVTAPGLFGGCTTVGLTIYYVSGPTQFVLSLHGLQWVNVTNDVKDAVALTRVDWRRRSDTGKANASPRSAVPHVLRVPSNCERKVTLPTIDSDGDAVACRFQNKTSVLKLTPNCTMTFIPGANVSYAEGKYAVQLIMEDFPRQNITLTDGKGNAIPLQSENALGQIPIQFLLMVDPRVESCVEGEYLPAFLPPTPANGDLLFASVDETLKIYINTIARKANSTEMIFIGPPGMVSAFKDGLHFLVWTPIETDLGQSQHVCFIVQALERVTLIVRHSEMRCVIVTVVPVVVELRARLRSAFPLYESTFNLTQIKAELVMQGLPADITLRLLSFDEKTATATPSGGETQTAVLAPSTP